MFAYIYTGDAIYWSSMCFYKEEISRTNISSRIDMVCVKPLIESQKKSIAYQTPGVQYVLAVNFSAHATC